MLNSYLADRYIFVEYSDFYSFVLQITFNNMNKKYKLVQITLISVYLLSPINYF